MTNQVMDLILTHGVFYLSMREINLLFFLCLMTIFFIGGCGEPGYAVKLAWNVPTTNSDGTTLSDLAGYELSFGTSPGNYSRKILIPLRDKSLDCNGSGHDQESDIVKRCNYTVTGLREGNYYFVISAYNSRGEKSMNSNEVMKTALRIK